MTHKKSTPTPQDAYDALGNDLKGLSTLLDTFNSEKKPSIRIWKEILKTTDDISDHYTAVESVLTSLNTPEAKTFQQNLGGLIEQFSDFNQSGKPEIDMPAFKSGMITEIMSSVLDIINAMNKVQFPTQKAA